MNARLRLLLAGAGAIGRAHAERARAGEEFELAGIADPSASGATFAASLDVTHWRDLDTALDALKPDGVILATPNTLHVQGALACLSRGIPVLIEKPVADTLDQAWRLVDAVERTGVPVLVGHHRRHSAVMAAARDVIAAGELGRLVAVQGSALFHKPASYFTEAPWRREKGAGPILINMVHEVDNLRMLAGEIVEVQAIASNARREHAVEDTVSIALRFANGALGGFLLSDVAASTRSWEQTSGENPAYARDARGGLLPRQRRARHAGGADAAAADRGGRALVGRADGRTHAGGGACRPTAAPASTLCRGDPSHRDAARQRARRDPHAAGHAGNRAGGGERAARAM